MDKVQHFEIPYDDKERAKKFYSEVFGWNIQDIPEMNYTFVHTVETSEDGMPKEAAAINGGLMPRDETGKTPVIVVTVTSVEDYEKKITEAGGSVVMPRMQVGDMGIYSRVKDSEGNIIGIWQSLKE